MLVLADQQKRIFLCALWMSSWEINMIIKCSKLAKREYQTGVDGKCQLRCVQNTEFDKMVNAHIRIHPKNVTYKIIWNKEIQTHHLTPTRRPDIKNQRERERERESEREKKKKEGERGDFAFPPGHKRRIKKSQLINKYVDLARELKTSNGTWGRWWQRF